MTDEKTKQLKDIDPAFAFIDWRPEPGADDGKADEDRLKTAEGTKLPPAGYAAL